MIYTLNSPLAGTLVEVLPETCIQDGTVVLLYDATRDYAVSGGTCSALTPVIGGTAADVLVQANVSLQPKWGQSAKVGGRSALWSTGTEWMRSAVPASAIQVPQPLTVIWVGGCPSAAGTYKYLWGAAAGTFNCVRNNTGGTLYIHAGVVGSIGLSDPTNGVILTAKFAGAGSSGRLRSNGGGLSVTDPVNAGVGDLPGFTLFARTALGSYFGDALMSVLMVVTGLSVADTQRLEQWSQLPKESGGCGFSGWTP